jgi:serine/threonine-protein kinase
MVLERISHYVVDRLIGVGGMGEVYLAEDATLHRKVALKLLPQRFTEDAERVRRFQREARAASALNHPNIITIYEVGEDANRHFIATEFIEGTTLRDRINSPEPMTIGEMLDASIGIACAMAAAHGAGIVHRDIKPENIMVRPDGYVKVLDFGLAKLFDGEHMTDSTTGAVMGTLLYLSPEQARGYSPDARSDIYSSGAVMYEMLTRQLPITADSFVDLAIAIATRDPEPPSRLVANVPPELDRIILKALQRDRTNRYATAHEMFEDLQTLRRQLEFEKRLGAVAAGAPQRPGHMTATLPLERAGSSLGLLAPLGRRVNTRQLSILVVLLLCTTLVAYAVGRGGTFRERPIDTIVVLPFDNASSDQNNEYLSDGIADSVRDSLSQIPRLQIIARSTAAKYKGKRPDPLLVGRDLRVRGVVTGELMQRGNTFIVRAALTDVEKGTQVWGEQYDRGVTDLVTIQQEMAERISEALRLKLTGEERQRIARAPVVNGEAYQAYLRGRYDFNAYTEESVRRSIVHFNEAIAQDRSFAPAYAALAISYYNLANVYMSPREAMPKAREAAERAVRLDPSLSDAHVALALVRTWYDWDFAEGEHEFRTALMLNPNDAEAHRYYAEILIVTQQFDRAITEKRRAVQLDPLSFAASLDVGRTLFYAGRLAEAEQQVNRTLRLDPKSSSAYMLRGEIAAGQGRYDDALALLDKAISLNGQKPVLISMSGYMNAIAGHREKALKTIEQLKSSSRYTAPLFLARVNAGLGDRDEALHWLGMLYSERSESVVWLKVDPTMKTLRSDPRFVALAKRIGV